ncbi:hypothetical protein [Streptomyces sp. C10-9-1]|uniref:hypothetical protein n=1 Tax=Streptomyces sp. C10-9-1 TaxID=1859285 RepID=UPI003F4A7566
MARTPRNPVLAGALALAATAAAAACWGGWSWYAAAHDDAAAFAHTREEVLAAGRQTVRNLNTLDHRDLRRGLDGWEDSATGDLHDQLTDGRAAFEKQIREAGTVTEASVLSAAVTELDERAGKARVLVALRITVTAPEGEPVRKESRMLAALTRTPGGWKLSALGQAPVGRTAAE